MELSSVLMVSISGIRGIVGKGLTPEIVLKFASAFGTFAGGGKIVVGRDSRITGEMIKNLVSSSLMSIGCDVAYIGITPTPTTQFITEKLSANGGIAITASHNPIEWNALKLIFKDGLFLDDEQGKKVIEIAEEKSYSYVEWNKVGKFENYEQAIDEHIEAILSLPYIDVEKIKRKKFKVVVDCVCGAGGVMVPKLLEKFGCDIIRINCETTGIFPRQPEPLPENLKELCELVKEEKADIGFATDPDVDRLAIVSEQGEPLGEEYTLALAVKFILSKLREPTTVVINMSTTRAVEDIANSFNCKTIRTRVGEINVAKKMREVKSKIGGEGNGGVILPDVHLGRDAPVGIALTLQSLADSSASISEIYKNLPQYYITKKKIDLVGVDVDKVMDKITEKYSKGAETSPAERDGAKGAHSALDFTDGIKIDRKDSWIHLRKSNTEPIIRIITEAKDKNESEKLCDEFIKEIKNIK